MKTIDLNCDMGETPEAVADGSQESLMPSLTSVNVACGGHAGDQRTMSATIEQASRWRLAIGAHPGYPDRANFGRIRLNLPPEAVAETVFEQVSVLSEIAGRQGARLTHVKAHGALYNEAARDRSLALAIAEGVSRWCERDRNAARLRSDIVLVGLAGSRMLDVFREAGFSVASEAFADRRYEPDGRLRARKFDDALIGEPEEAAGQALHIAERGRVITLGGAEIAVDAQTICIHGDTPGAPAIAAAVAQTLRFRGIALRPLRVF